MTTPSQLEDYAKVCDVIAHVSENWREQPSLETLAARVKLTPDQLQRLFTRWAGLTPKAFLQALTLDHARVMLSHSASILETALDNGIDLPYSCQSGLCTACRGKALSGQVKLDEEEGLSQSERAEGYVLTCVGHPMTDDVVIEIG